jgi:hypothetical protein
MEGYKDNSGFNAVFGSSGGGSAPTISRDFGSFHSEQDQVCAIDLSENQVALEVTDTTFGVSAGTDGTISFTNQGMYMIELTLQFAHANPPTTTSDYAYVWLAQNGGALPQTTRQIILNATMRENVLTLSYLVSVYPFPTSLPTLQVFWTATTTDLLLAYIPAPMGSVYPNNPSVICNVFQVA